MNGRRGTHQRKKKCIRRFGSKREGKRALERPGPRWEVNIETDLEQIGWEGVYWIFPAQDRGKGQCLIRTVTEGYFQAI